MNDNNEENNCIIEDDYISIEKKTKKVQNNMKDRAELHKKQTTSNLNFKLSLIVFIFMVILALVIILNKGTFGKISLIPVNDLLHTAELECDSYFLSTLDAETTGISLTIDGNLISEGFTLKSSDEEIARIEENKIIAGEKAGTVTITAYYEKFDMTIATDIVTYIPINTVFASLSRSTISVGNEATMTISILPQDGTDKYIKYYSDDTTVATVDENGNIIGVGAGKAIITVEDELTGASAMKTITVK